MKKCKLKKWFPEIFKLSKNFYRHTRYKKLTVMGINVRDVLAMTKEGTIALVQCETVEGGKCRTNSLLRKDFLVFCIRMSQLGKAA